MGMKIVWSDTKTTHNFVGLSQIQTNTRWRITNVIGDEGGYTNKRLLFLSGLFPCPLNHCTAPLNDYCI